MQNSRGNHFYAVPVAVQNLSGDNLNFFLNTLLKCRTNKISKNRYLDILRDYPVNIADVTSIVIAHPDHLCV
ncbi:MAG: hypothetical protein WDO19_03025 [Bacteroidota bacterium]